MKKALIFSILLVSNMIYLNYVGSAHADNVVYVNGPLTVDTSTFIKCMHEDSPQKAKQCLESNNAK